MKKEKLKVEIEPPENGWTHVKLISGSLEYSFVPSHVPYDSIFEFSKRIAGSSEYV